MSLSPQLISEQVKEIVEDEKNTDKSESEVQEQLEDGEEVLNPENTSSVQNTVLNTINNECEHKCLGEAVRLLNACPIQQSTDGRVPGRKNSIPGLPGTDGSEEGGREGEEEGEEDDGHENDSCINVSSN